MFDAPIFADRADAGRRLGAALVRFKNSEPLILALPRGGVPVAFEVARALRAELDLLIVRKLGAPGHAELGIGAVVDGADPQLVLNEELVRIIAPPPGYIEGELRRQLLEIRRRRERYPGDRAPIDVAGRTVIVVDDGVATGGTAKAALRGIRRSAPSRLVLAVPVASVEGLADLRDECDDLVCLVTPDPLYAISAHYKNFSQTSDSEVETLVRQASTLRGDFTATS